MRALVVGGTGVVGPATVTALLERGHTVRLLNRNAVRDVEEWPHRVEAWPGDVANAMNVRGSAEGCDAVIHLAAILDESPPDATFEKVNVGGTENVVREAERAGVRTLVYVSSLGAERGESGYHRSKLQGEEIARTFRGGWSIVRLGNVYGEGDDQISLLLKMIRTLPVVPVLGDGNHAFQPLFAEDAGRVLAEAAEREDLHGRTLEVAGPEETSMNDLIERIARITERNPKRVPVPMPLATVGIRLAEVLGVDTPLNIDQLTMLREENVVRAPDGNAIGTVFHVRPTSLDDGLAKLADRIPEQLPEEGVGWTTRKRFWADIRGSRLHAETLFERFRRQFAELTPWQIEVGAEPGTPTTPEEGATLTMTLPMRGNVQVRIEELTARRMTLVTLEGHPLAGAVRFLVEPRGDRLRFEVQVYDRAAKLTDWLVMNPVGGRLQNATWRETVERVVAESGGRAPDGVEEEVAKLDEQQTALVNRWLDELVTERKRRQREARIESRAPIVERDLGTEGKASS